MADFYGKSDSLISTKVPESLKRRVEEIAASEERTVSQVLKMLLIRGLSLYEIDGQLRGEAPAKAMRQLAPVVARIERGEMSKQDVQRMIETTDTVKVPVRRKVS